MGQPAQRNGKLRIPLPFDQAVQAALETKPADTKPKAKKRRGTRKPPAKR